MCGVLTPTSAQIDYYGVPQSFADWVGASSVIVEAEFERAFPPMPFKDSSQWYSDALFKVVRVIKGPQDLCEIVVAIPGTNSPSWLPTSGRTFLLLSEDPSPARMAGLPQRAFPRFEMYGGRSLLHVQGVQIQVMLAAASGSWRQTLQTRAAADVLAELASLAGVPVGDLEKPIRPKGDAERLPCRMAPPPIRVEFSVSGQINSTIDPAAVSPHLGAGVAPLIYVIQRDAGGSAQQVARQRPLMRDGGPFGIAGLPPGAYDLFASIPVVRGWGPAITPGEAPPFVPSGARPLRGERPPVPLQPLTFGRASIDLREDRTGIAINVHPGVDLKGRVTLDGRPAAPAGLRVLFEPDPSAVLIDAYALIGKTPAAIGDDGAFTMPSLPEARYRIQVELPETAGLALSEILQEGKSIKDSGLAIDARPPAAIEIVLKTAGATR
jgi:hypothetical protein